MTKETALEEIKDTINEISTALEKNEIERSHYPQLSHVYEALMLVFNGKANKVLDTSCTTCVSSAVKMARNYILYHEGGKSTKEKPSAEQKEQHIVTLGTKKEETVKLDQIRVEYERLTGKKPHHKMKGEKMLAEIDEIKANQDGNTGQ